MDTGILRKEKTSDSKKGINQKIFSRLIGRRTGIQQFSKRGKFVRNVRVVETHCFVCKNFNSFETNFGAFLIPPSGTVRIPNAGLVLAMMAGLQAVAPRAMHIFKFVEIY